MQHLKALFQININSLDWIQSNDFFFISAPKGGRVLLVLNIQKGIQLPHITSFQHVNLKSNYDKLDCVLRAGNGRMK